jgi:hypothetical protein
MSSHHRPILAVLLALGLAAMACGFPAGQQETAIAQTVEAAQRAGAEEAPPPTEAPPETPTWTPSPEVPDTPTLTPTVTSTLVPCDRAAFVTDVTVPDGSDYYAGQAFTKTWRLRNNGSCTWTSGYALVFDHGDAMGAPASVQLTTGTVAPGQTVDISVNLTAPGSVGTYRGYFLLRNPSAVVFGIGANADVAFWVEIEVVPSGVTLSIPPLILTPMVAIIFPYSSGTGQTIMEGACFDLDAGSLAGCGAAASDFEYQMEFGGFPPSMDFEVNPLHTAAFRGAGGSEPSKATCQAASLTTSDIEVSSGAYYCYRTSDGRYGWMRPSSVDMTHMVFDWKTYN